MTVVLITDPGQGRFTAHIPGIPAYDEGETEEEAIVDPKEAHRAYVDASGIEDAHSSVGGSTPSRRYATQQINHACAMLLSSQFQGFCRDLHSESVDCLVRVMRPVNFRSTVREEFR